VGDRLQHGVLVLTMEDMTTAQPFESCERWDVVEGLLPLVARARFMFLLHQGSCRVLKAQGPLIVKGKKVL